MTALPVFRLNLDACALVELFLYAVLSKRRRGRWLTEGSFLRMLGAGW